MTSFIDHKSISRLRSEVARVRDTKFLEQIIVNVS